MQQCANPDCRAAFRYFRGGKIYRFNPRHFGDDGPDKSVPSPDQFYWLCGACYSTLRLVMRPDGCVVLQLVPPKENLAGLSVAIGWGTQRAA